MQRPIYDVGARFISPPRGQRVTVVYVIGARFISPSFTRPPRPTSTRAPHRPASLHLRKRSPWEPSTHHARSVAERYKLVLLEAFEGKGAHIVGRLTGRNQVRHPLAD